MHRQRKSTPGHALALALICLVSASSAAAQVRVETLKEAFDVAWSRQPEAVALQLRRDAAQAQQQAAQAWTPEPPALAISDKSDRLSGQRGAHELEVGVAVPLWLPGERAGSNALANAERESVESRAVAARLRIAGVLRDAWWQRQRAQVELDVARDQLANARRLAADVATRLAAGDLARADQHQADGAVAAAESAEAGAVGAQAAALGQLRAVAGGVLPTTGDHGVREEPEPPPGAGGTTHPAIGELEDRVAVAESAAALSTTRSRANPEMTLTVTRARDFRGERYDSSLTLGIRIPLGAGSAHAARVAAARAEATELEAQLALQRQRITGEHDTSRQRVAAARAQLSAAERRARLAGESRGFFDKSFRLGETDLPTRLRIEAEAAEATRQAMTARIEVAAAISQWRQALGLLPE